MALDLAGQYAAVSAAVTTRAKAITGVRTAYDFDAWPESPPGMYVRNAALHLTGFWEEEPMPYYQRGIDLSEWEFTIPLYTVVCEAAKVKRARSWMLPYPDRYRSTFDTRVAMLDVGEGNDGSLQYRGGRIVRGIADWPEFEGFYIYRHDLRAHIKGAVDRG